MQITNPPLAKISIIIPSYRNEAYLKNCLLSLKKAFSFPEAEIIVVDIAPLATSSSFEGVSLLPMTQNKGFGAACNLGAKKACADLLFFLNPDTELLFLSAKEIFDAFRDKELVLAGLPLRLPSGKPQPFGYGEFPSLFNILRTNIFGEKRNPRKDWVSGAALIIRRDIFWQIGGFDENFFLYFEDVDLCKRALGGKGRAVLLEESKVLHFGGKSTGNSRLQKKNYYKSQDLYFAKHCSETASLLVKFLRLLTHPLPH